MDNFPSKLVENAVNELSRLPGIGKKTALRLALHLLKQEENEVENFGNAVIRMRKECKFCVSCHNISDNDICEICNNQKRNHSFICVVEDVRDVMAIENTSQFNGIYHVLGGIISPMEGISPSDLNIDSLVAKVGSGNITEIIMALPATIEGDTTIFYLYKKLKAFDITVTTIARGIAVGDDLEYTDEITLGRSIINRTPYSMSS
ncbi:MAG: recombination mediator RecR [Bacteroidetes bacterium]|nr:recombination mediator RecR [Bacteroidota bacterium]